MQAISNKDNNNVLLPTSTNVVIMLFVNAACVLQIRFDNELMTTTLHHITCICNQVRSRLISQKRHIKYT